MNYFFKRRKQLLAGTAIALCLLVFLLACHRELSILFTQPHARTALSAWIHKQGIWGIALFLAIQILQIAIAFLPGEPVELAAGLLYGSLGGTLLCLLGTLLGSLLIYHTVRIWGTYQLPLNSLKKYRLLRDEAHIKLTVFFLFFIPGTPKDLFIYAGPFLPISARSFLLISSLARIPSILTSTLSAEALSQGNWQMGAMIYSITGMISVLCIWKQDRLIAVLHRMQCR